MNSNLATASTGTRAQILLVSRDLIQARSYLGFSFQDVADQVGVRKASLYHHFPSKEALGIEVIRVATEGFKDWAQARTGTPQQQLQAYFKLYHHALHAGDGMCPGGAMASGWDCINDDLRHAVRELRGTQVLWLTGVVGGLGLKNPPASFSQLAASVFATCQGALVAARMTGRAEDFDEALRPLKSVLSV